jgi:hypothetical protein
MNKILYNNNILLQIDSNNKGYEKYYLHYINAYFGSIIWL